MLQKRRSKKGMFTAELGFSYPFLSIEIVVGCANSGLSIKDVFVAIWKEVHSDIMET